MGRATIYIRLHQWIQQLPAVHHRSWLVNYSQSSLLIHVRQIRVESIVSG